MQDLENVINSLGAGFLLIDREHRIEWTNKKAVEWFGSLKIGERRKCYRTMAYSNSFCEVCPTGRTIDLGIPTHYEFRLPEDTSLKYSKKNHKPSNFEVIGIPVFDRSGHVLRVMELVLDVTEKGIEKIRSEELMAHIEKMAAIGHLAAGVAHELNTPLATISIASRELKCLMDGIADGKITKEELMDYFSDIEQEIKRCQIIVDDLLNFSKKGVSERIETDINGSVSNAINLIQKGEGYKGVTILKDFDRSIPLVKTDPERFRQVVFNILKNAVESVMDNENGRIIVATAIDGCYIKVVISDNGPGISSENFKRIFEPFFTTKPVGKGTGLGLFVSYGIMKDLMGDIKIVSRVGEGTTVSLLLPVE